MSRKLPLCGTAKFVKMLRYDGFHLKKHSSGGSHDTYVKPKSNSDTHHVVVVVLNKKQYKLGLLDGMRKQAGWSRAKYERIFKVV